MKEPSLNRNLSIYLDFLRFTAAFAVFLGHAGAILFPKFNNNFLFQQGDNAVAVFFVLSGFVISHVASEKEQNFRSYFVARASRIYSVAILALIVTFIADRIGANYHPENYANIVFYRPESILVALRCLTFSNEFWFSNAVFGTNEPYWSLGFEVWYYIWFALILFLSGKTRIFGALFLMLLCGPKIILYLPLWLIGVLAHTHVVRFRQVIPKSLAASGFILSTIVYIFISKLLSPVSIPMFFWFNIPALEITAFVNFTLIGLMVYINIISFNVLIGNRPFWPAPIANLIQWFAGRTFTLYLVHLPILFMISNIFPIVSTDFLLGLLAFMATFLLALVLAEFGERRKNWFAMVIGYLIDLGLNIFKQIRIISP